MVVSIQTAIRVRPSLSTEDQVVSVISDTRQVVLDNRACSSTDYVFPSDSSQGFIYDACMVNRINLLFEGNDIFIISCGSCLSGKTHTLFELNCTGYEISYGLVPLSVHHIFNTLSRIQLHNYFRYTVYINFVQIVNGEVNDLLSLDRNKKYSLVTNNKGFKCISGVENILCRNVNEVFGCLKVGLQSKIDNKNNHEECNSHTLFTVSVYQQWIYSGGFENRVSKATFLDLGSSDSQLDDLSNSDLNVNFLSTILSSISSERTLIRSTPSERPILAALIKDAFTVSHSTLLICCLSPCSKDADQSLGYIQLLQQVKEQFCSVISEDPVCDSNTTTSSQELDNFSQQDIYISLATSQWMKLILNAEGLFHKLSHTGLSKEAKQQIDSWLCLKQEYDECFVESPTAPFHTKIQKSLECIEEVTESEANSSSCLTSINSESKENSKTEETVKTEVFCSINSNDFPKRQDFSSRLEILISKFRSYTDSKVDKSIDQFYNFDTEKTERQPTIVNQVSPNNLRRRKTILPGDVTLVLNKITSDEEQLFKREEIELTDIKEIADNKLALVATRSELKALSNEHECKQGQIDLIILDLEGAHKRIEELNQIIKIKEEFIGEMIQNSSTRNSCKVKLQRKLCKLEEEYFKTRANLARAEKAVKRGDANAHGQIEKFKTLSYQYEKRLHDLELVKSLTGDSAKKVIELETSLFNSKRKLQKLLKQLKKEEELKSNLEKELEEDQKRAKKLAIKLTACNQSDTCSVEGTSRIKQIEEEEKKLKILQESSQKLKDQLLEQRGILEKRESFFKDKVCQEKSSSQHFLDLSAGSNSEEAQKGTKLEGAITEEVRESLRHEIRNLRKTRDCLVEQRRLLDAKINKDKVFTAQEERKFLECDEAIDAIDIAIEYKNEIMFGHMRMYEKQADWEQTDELLIERLMSLSHPEIRTLLTKYFNKVIDLRDSGHKLEQQIAEQDLQIEAQAWKIQTLTNALQQANIESERRLIMVHREHQEKLHLMFRQYAGETSGASSIDKDGDKLVLQNKALKHRVIELEGMLYSPKNAIAKPSTVLSIPHENIKKLQGTPSALVTTTKVTRQKNKLIIQQQKTKKRSK